MWYGRFLREWWPLDPQTAAGRGVFAAVYKPENTKRENSVDCGQGLFRIDGDYAPSHCSPRQHAACVGGPKAVFKIGSCLKAFGGPIGKTARRDMVENAEIFRARGLTRGGRAAVPIRNQLQHLGTALAETSRFKVRRVFAGPQSANGADEVALLRPQMQRAAALFGGQGIARRSPVEDHAAIFQDGGLRILGEKSSRSRASSAAGISGEARDIMTMMRGSEPRIKGFVLELLPASTLS